MRSRYSAYALGAVDYILDTTDPEGPQFRQDREAWAEEVRRFSQTTRFEKLEILSAHGANDEANDGPNDTEHGEVEFFAKLSRGGQDVSFTERSLFVRRAGRWLYVSGVTKPLA